MLRDHNATPKVGWRHTARKLAEEDARSLSERILSWQHDERRRISCHNPRFAFEIFMQLTT